MWGCEVTTPSISLKSMGSWLGSLGPGESVDVKQLSLQMDPSS